MQWQVGRCAQLCRRRFLRHKFNSAACIAYMLKRAADNIMLNSTVQLVDNGTGNWQCRFNCYWQCGFNWATGIVNFIAGSNISADKVCGTNAFLTVLTGKGKWWAACIHCQFLNIAMS
jgi:hypothetical protein